MKLEINLEGMFELGKVSKKMEHVAFSPDLITTICDLFPTTIQDELTEEELVIGSLLYKLQLGFTYNVHMINQIAGSILKNVRALIQI